MQFFVADGVYRRQAFAVEDPGDGTVLLYAGNAIEKAIAAGILTGSAIGEGDAKFYCVGADPAEFLQIDELTAENTASAPDHYRHMLGWNRRAIRIAVPTTSTQATLQAIEAICALGQA